MPGLTAVILARDEATYIGGCVESLLPLTTDIVVIDSGSHDATRQLATGLGARVIERKWAGFPAQRNAALDLAADSAWLLFLDADERLTPASRAEIIRALESATGETAGYLIPRRSVIAGHIMRGGGWWPDYQARLLRPQRCRYDEARRVHEVPECDGPLFALNHPLIHLNFLTWRSFAARQFAYEHAAAFAADRPRRRAYLGGPAREFWSRFVTQRGYRDGIAGLVACALVAAAKPYGVWLARRGWG